MSAGELQAALAAQGIRAEVWAEGAVAVMTLDRDDASVADPAVRRSLVALALAHGFRNLALDVAD